MVHINYFLIYYFGFLFDLERYRIHQAIQRCSNQYIITSESDNYDAKSSVIKRNKKWNKQ